MQHLKNCPAEQRDVFTLHELDGMSFKDIATQTGRIR
jgi:DNA-directed RNA polymerase specialized sigma24 family protein